MLAHGWQVGGWGSDPPVQMPMPEDGWKHCVMYFHGVALWARACVRGMFV